MTRSRTALAVKNVGARQHAPYGAIGARYASTALAARGSRGALQNLVAGHCARIGVVNATLAQQRAHITATLAAGSISTILARQHALYGDISARHASTALARGGSIRALQNLVAGHCARIGAVNATLAQQRAHITATLAAGSISTILARQHALYGDISARHASAALARGGSIRALQILVAGHCARIGAVSVALAQQRSHITAALATSRIGTILARQQALADAVNARHACTALAGGSIGAVQSLVAGHRARIGTVSAALVQQRSHITAALATSRIGTILARQQALADAVNARHACTALAGGRSIGDPSAGRGGRIVLRPFLPTEPIPTATRDEAPHVQPFGLAGEIDAFLEQTLARLNPAFLRQFRGSVQRSEERGPDWWTQSAASERKLFLGVLHAAAPDDHVVPWVTKPSVQLDRSGRPTRRTKIAWLCRSIPNESYRRVLITELDSALALIDLFSTAVHVDDFPEFEEIFSWIHLRMKVAIRHILEIWSRRP